jgi:plastocyanin
LEHIGCSEIDPEELRLMLIGKLVGMLLSMMALSAIFMPGFAQPVGIPAITITQPMNGSSVPAGNITVMVGVTDFNLSCDLGSAAEIGTGHIHYYMDVAVPTAPGRPAITAPSTYIPTANVSCTWKNLQPGDYNLSAQLVNNDHTPFIPLAYDTVIVTVTGTGNNTTSRAPNQTMSQNMTPPTSANASHNLVAVHNQPVAQNVTRTRSAKVGSGKVVLSIAARNMAFNTSTITVPASLAVSIKFHNQDSGTYHNIAIYTDSSANSSIFIGMPVIGISTIAYTFTAPSIPGTYFFRDDKHPQNMSGRFIVS